jgi:peptide deformylase
MAERPVLRMGDPRLYRVGAPVERFATAELEALVEDLWDTMEARGGIGLAATQIDVPLRVVVLGMERSVRYPEAPPIPRTVLVNPVITPEDDETEDAWEGCLSVPGLRGLVPRWRRIHLTARNPRGESIEARLEGFHARVVQHECDHLDGVLYPMRMRDLSTLGFEEELARARGEDVIRCED